ncbi:MAG: cysteine desulfurase, partial [Patescibacteria group bacterium]|nr:cysteine desulfurase [Patescibacteria group bacterium]
MYVNNELGTVMPLRKISKVIEDVKTDRRDRNVDTPLYFHTDACQAPLYLDVHAERLGIDMMTLNGSKIYGPKQTGMLYVKTGTEIEPIVRGGGQEWGKRSGTENVSGVIGFCTAFQNARNNTNKDSVSVAALQQLFIKELASFIPNATVNGTTKYRSPNNIHVTFPGFDNERLMMELDEAGILCAVGSACSASSDEPSHVLKAIGMSDQEAQSSLRFTLGKHTTASDIEYAIKTLRKLLTA